MQPMGGIICSLIDAKNDNCYWSAFENIGGNYLLRKDFDINNINNILSELNELDTNCKLTFVGDGAISHKDRILQAFPECSFESSEISASKLALSGLKAFRSRHFKQITSYVST